jgi:hypothetical protein
MEPHNRISAQRGAVGGSPLRGLLSPHGFLTAVDRLAQPQAGDVDRATLPLIELITTKAASSTFCAVSAIDDRGRLTDRAALKELGWAPATPIMISAMPGAGVCVVRRNGREAITRQGHLRLPARVRHSLRLKGGERLLLLALTEDDVLLAYLASALDDMVVTYHAGLTEAEVR